MSALDISSAQFRELASRTTEIAAKYLDELRELPAYPATSGEEVDAIFRPEFPEMGQGSRAFDALDDVIKLIRPNGPRFYGYVLGTGDPVAALGDYLASILNQNVTAWRSSPAAVTIERTVVSWLAEAVGCKGFSGSLTGGGSSANLMALAMAREAKLASNDRGVQGIGTVYASSEVHMSIGKAIAMLGLGRNNLRAIPVNENFQIDTAALDESIGKDVRDGCVPVAVLASAGTVNTGAIDDFAAVANIARKHNAWFHVDGAYGALAAMAIPDSFRGMQLADSISLDPHKWLYQPVDCGCVLYRDRAHARMTFSYSGEYTRVLNEDPLESFAFFEESMELSRRFRALKLWLSIRYHGMSAFRDAIRNDLKLAQHLAQGIEQQRGLELLAPVTLSAVCFRVVETGTEAKLNSLNAAVLKRVIARRRVYLSNAVIHGKFALRACIVNQRATERDVEEVVSEVLAAAKELEGS